MNYQLYIKRQMSTRNRKRMKGCCHGQLEVLSRHLPRDTEENTKNMQQDPMCPSGSSKQIPSEYSYVALPLELFCRWHLF
jgi:hypothetical protein